MGRRQILAQESTLLPKILFLYCEGGWDQTMVFDPKINISNIDRESGQKAKIGSGGLTYVGHDNRQSVDQFFQKYGQNSVIVNGIYTSSLAFPAAAQALFSTNDRKKPLRRKAYLDFYGAQKPNLPYPHMRIDISDFSSTAAELSVGINQEYLNAISSENEQTNKTQGQSSEIEEYLFNNYSRFIKKFREQSRDFERTKVLRSQLNALHRLDDIIRDLYIHSERNSENSWIETAKFALNLFKGDFAQSVAMRVGDAMAWNTQEDYFNKQAQLFNNLFIGLNQICEYAASEHQIENLLIIVASERGRSPQLNSEEFKSPWPYTSMLLHGPGLKGGSTVGLSDDMLIGRPLDPIFGEELLAGDPLRFENVFAAIFLKYGLTINELFPSSLKPLAAMLSRA